MSSEIKEFISVSFYISTLVTLSIIRFMGRVLHVVGKKNSSKIVVKNVNGKSRYVDWNIEIYMLIKSLCASDDYNTESYKYCSKCSPPVTRYLLARRTVFSKTVFSTAQTITKI
jgi:hypothetical protein